MKFVGLTGTIGSGKSTVAGALAERGAAILDVDEISRRLREPGQPFYDMIVARWGPPVLDSNGWIDRAALARVVFADRAQLAELTAMVAPLAERELVRRAQEYLGSDRVVVVESALYQTGAYGMSGLILVDAPINMAVRRLVHARGMTEDDARARIAVQIPRERRLETADYVVDNSGGKEDLERAVDGLGRWLLIQPDAVPSLTTSRHLRTPR